MKGVSWGVRCLGEEGWCFMGIRCWGGVFTVAAGAGVIISHYPQGRRLCSPVTSGFIELAALCCLLPAGKIQHFHSTECTCLVASVISVALHYPFDSDGHF